jgi:hypothetical protein
MQRADRQAALVIDKSRGVACASAAVPNKQDGKNRQEASVKEQLMGVYWASTVEPPAPEQLNKAE